MATDFPKIKSPFVRAYKINDWGQEAYVVTPDIEPGYEWVFEDPNVIAVEKLDGTNVSVVIRDGRIQSIWNRTSEIPFFNRGKGFIIQGILKAFDRGYLDLPDGQHFGELIGPKVNGDKYQLSDHIWVPFNTYCHEHLCYKSWGKYQKDFVTISNWFHQDIFSLYFCRLHKGVKMFPEGVVFYHPDGRMAKLRRDMFPWCGGKQHKE